MFDGSRAIFEKAQRQASVTIYPVLPNGKIILTNQEQPGKEPFIGGLGGRVEEDEDAPTAAHRELLEESGYTAEKFILWFADNATPKVDWPNYYFVAKGLKKVSDLNLDAGEKIKLVEMTLDELINVPLRKDIHFNEKELFVKFLEAKYNPERRKELEELFKP